MMRETREIAGEKRRGWEIAVREIREMREEFKEIINEIKELRERINRE